MEVVLTWNRQCLESGREGVIYVLGGGGGWINNDEVFGEEVGPRRKVSAAENAIE